MLEVAVRVLNEMIWASSHSAHSGGNSPLTGNPPLLSRVRIINSTVVKEAIWISDLQERVPIQEIPEGVGEKCVVHSAWTDGSYNLSKKCGPALERQLSG